MIGPIINHNYENMTTLNTFTPLSSYYEIDLKGPVYDHGAGKSHYDGIIQSVETLKNLIGPVYNIGQETAHKYADIQKHVESLKTLNGPKYDIDSGHHFSEIIKNVEELKDLTGPVYNIGEPGHNYNVVMQKVQGLKDMVGPVYVEQGGHHFNEIKKHADVLKELKGPVYLDEKTKHHFAEIQKHVESLQSLKGPVYVTDDYKHHFSEIDKHVETLKTLSGPVYDVAHSCKFSELIAKVDNIKNLVGPVYDIGKAEHHFNEMEKQAESLRLLAGSVSTRVLLLVYCESLSEISVNLMVNLIFLLAIQKLAKHIVHNNISTTHVSSIYLPHKYLLLHGHGWGHTTSLQAPYTS